MQSQIGPNLQRRSSLASVLVALLLIACANDSSDERGSLRVLIDPEDVIIRGLAAGDSGEQVRDGWRVRFDKYLVVVGDVELRFATDHAREAHMRELHVVDLVKVPQSGLELWNFDALAAGRWAFGFAVGGAADDAARHASVTATDFEKMVERDWSYLVEGSISKSDGRSCPPSALAAPPASASPTSDNESGDACYSATEVRFSFGARAQASFGPCEIDGVPGVSIPAGGEQTAAITIHGDHLFFNGFPEGGEGSVRRLAQWWADADLDVDGTITEQELRAIAPAQVLDDRYSFGGSPIQPLENMYTYVVAQLQSQGHFQGEGECLVDGIAHDHEGDDASEAGHDPREAGQKTPHLASDGASGIPPSDASAPIPDAD